MNCKCGEKIECLQKENAELKAEVSRLEAEIDRLEDIQCENDMLVAGRDIVIETYEDAMKDFYEFFRHMNNKEMKELAHRKEATKTTGDK